MCCYKGNFAEWEKFQLYWHNHSAAAASPVLAPSHSCNCPKSKKAPQQPCVKIRTHLVRLQYLYCFFWGCFLKGARVCYWWYGLSSRLKSKSDMPGLCCPHQGSSLSPHSWNPTALSATEFPGISPVPSSVHFHKGFLPQNSPFSLILELPSCRPECLEASCSQSKISAYFLPSDHFLLAPTCFLSIF